MANKFLHYGDLLREILLNSPGVAAITTDIFPLMRDKATLPYIIYRRAGMSSQPVMRGASADTLTYQLQCCTKTYAESLALAAAVREALDGIQADGDGLHIRHCLMTDAQEFYASDAFVQELTFLVKM